MKYSIQDFRTDFPDDEACLARIFYLRYGSLEACPKCGKEAKFHPISKRRAYACQWCGHHLYPCAGTIFEKSSTSLSKWFHAMYLMTATRNGVSAKELERQLGVTYKCAWRMGHQIRALMAERNAKGGPLTGHIEADETYVGGKVRGKGRGPTAGKNKTIVFGMLERDGRVMAKTVPDVRHPSLRPIIERNVLPGSTISTDEMSTYEILSQRGYQHGSVKHCENQWVNGIHHTNGIENFWKHLKGGIRSTHIHVSRKYLQNYVEEFGFRFNNRKEPALMFYRMLAHLSQQH